MLDANPVEPLGLQRLSNPGVQHSSLGPKASRFQNISESKNRSCRVSLVNPTGCSFVIFAAWARKLQLNEQETPVKVILLVEDSKFLRMANARALGKAGFRVVTANDGEEALRIAIDDRPDLILLDMLLPKMGGVEVLRALRKNPSTSTTPIVSSR